MGDLAGVQVTGHVLPEHVSHFLSCGADRVINKPLNMHVSAHWLMHGASFCAFFSSINRQMCDLKLIDMHSFDF